MNIDSFTYGELKAIAAMFASKEDCLCDVPKPVHDPVPVVVCTDKRGVIFGYCTDITTRPLQLTAARMCLYWSADIGGVFGLGENGPTKTCKISATLPGITLEGVTAIFSVDPSAEKAWLGAKTQGR